MKAGVTLFGLLSLSAGAFADEPRHAFECDTPAGHFSYWKRSLSSSTIEVTGKVTVNELLKDKKWSPAMNIVLFEGKARYGIHIYGVMKTPDLLFAQMLKVGGHDDLGLGGIIPRTKDAIPFTLSLGSDGILKATLAGTEATTSLGSFKPDSFEISCSTGDFEFTDVVVKEN